MELALSAVAGELVSRFLSFLADRYLHSSHPAQWEEKHLKKLRQLLLRAHTVVEEADGRYITNSGMLAQLSMLADAMYRGYWALGASRYISLEKSMEEGVVRNPSPPKRFRMVHGSARKNKATSLVDLQGALESLEDVVAGMTEFVVLLGGCDRMLRRPYDAYLYNDNIMFGRHAEKQKLLNFMLWHNSPGGGAPAILPIIGAPEVGKRTLVAHVCKDDRVRSHFSSILHLNGDSFSSLVDHDRSLLPGKILVVVELVSDVDEDDWAKFCSAVATSMDNGSKVVIISRLKSTERLGTVEPILLNTLSYEEFSYLFKTLAFGSANPAQHPRLARIADDLARESREFHSEYSLCDANILADLMRRNLNNRFWFGMQSRVRKTVEKNLSMFGAHPRLLAQRRQQIDITDFVLHPAASPLCIVPSYTSGSSRTEVVVGREFLPRVRLGDLVMDTGVRPQGDFNVVAWESRLPPYTSLVLFVPNGDGAPGVVEQSTPLSGRKRATVPL
ncbi:putative disease resistance protein RGA3 [Triticum dicoccoides]|uniref:putative disease resistance protein RGA3 n=1 Tax=Triticum dicoccoides TaxID=85692 RepID=UPI00188E96F0|nr:putative disease resistance protein RGA3 [Triticum dicoccoides]